ncbi:MAG: phytanoyl-CoA dioxygenase family protein [Pseudomonadota bacterium]
MSGTRSAAPGIDLDTWHRKGYLVIERFFPEAEIASLRELTDTIVAEGRTLERSDERFDIARDGAMTHVRRIKHPDALHEGFRQIARHSRIVAVLEGLFAQGVRLEVGKINLKLPNEGGEIAWHQDYAFSPLTNDSSAAVGIFVDDVTEDNGPLMLVPGSHRWPLMSHHQHGRFVGRVTEQDPVSRGWPVEAVTAPAGSISIHHCRTLHASAENRSAHARRIYFNQYHAADAWPYLGVRDLEWWTDRLLSGEESFAPRIVETDVTLPLPVQSHSSIFDLQAADSNPPNSNLSKQVT